MQLSYSMFDHVCSV